jgi:hypothetical protein
MDDRARLDARAVVTAAIIDRELGWEAWSIRDGIETLACLHRHSTRWLSRSDQRLLARAARAAEDAALAALVREHIADGIHRVLVAPFAGAER